MPTFAAWWAGLDIERRVEWGLLTDAQARREQHHRRRLRRAVVAFLRREGVLPQRRATRGRVLEAWLVWLARSPARIVLASLEDLWGETEPQNMPGVVDGVANWQRKARLRLEEFRDLAVVRRTTERINHHRIRRHDRPRGATRPRPRPRR